MDRMSGKLLVDNGEKLQEAEGTYPMSGKMPIRGQSGSVRSVG